MKIILHYSALTILFLGVGFILSNGISRSRFNTVEQNLTLCQHKITNISQVCNEPTSTIALIPAQLPDRTENWITYADAEYKFSLLHPSQLKVTIDPPTYDVIFRRWRIGSSMILEAVSGDGVGGNNQADYEHNVFNSIAQNTKPNWTNYNPGHSAEKFGDVTMYTFHTNIFDAFSSLDLSVPPSSSGLPLQGVIFHPSTGIDWMVYFQPKDDMMADNILRSMKFTD